MSPIGSDGVDPERKLIDHVVNEINGALLIVPFVDLERPNPCGVIDGRVLKATNLASISGFEREELHVHLDLMPGNLFGIPACVDRPPSHVSRQPSQAVSDERAIHT